MKKILLFSNDSTGRKMFDANIRDNCSHPFIYLRERLRSLGYELDVCLDIGDLTPEVRWVLFINSPFPKSDAIIGFRRWKNFIKPTKKSLGSRVYGKCLQKNIKIGLFLWEGEAVLPENYYPELFERFPLIFTWKKRLADNKKFFRFYLPVPDYANFPSPPAIPFSGKKLLSNVSRNRSSDSSKELYSEREKSIRYFTYHAKGDFDLFGMGWNKPKNRLERLFPFIVRKYPSYRGSVDNKSDVMPRYKFSICYENMRGEDDYVTEKIFDCFNLKTVPIYWGAENIEEYADPDSFIDRRKFPTNEDLYRHIATLDEAAHEKMLQAGQACLRSSRFARFLPRNFAETVINALDLGDIPS